VILQLLPITVYPQPRSALASLGWEHLLEEEGFVTGNQKTFSVSAPNSVSEALQVPVLAEAALALRAST